MNNKVTRKQLQLRKPARQTHIVKATIQRVPMHPLGGYLVTNDVGVRVQMWRSAT